MSATLILLAATAVVAAAVFWARHREALAAVPQVFCCPGCAQKVRYPAGKAGRVGACPRCRRRWVLPATAGPAEAGTAKATDRLRWRPTRLAAAGCSAGGGRG